jgi:hypothetical protein
MSHRWFFIAVSLTALSLPLSWSQARSECEKKLAEVDAALAESEGLDETRRQMIVGLREMAAGHCKRGQQGIASQMLDSLLDQLGKGGDGEAEPEAIPKDELTRDYLEGWWCLRTKRYERKTPILFEANGAHLIGQPAGDKYGMFPSGDDLKDFYRRFQRLISKGPKKFVVLDRHGHELSYERGRCPGIETAR